MIMLDIVTDSRVSIISAVLSFLSFLFHEFSEREMAKLLNWVP